MIKPKELTVTTRDGEEKTFILARFPAISGREIIAKYPLSAMPKLGDYAVNEETMLKLMAFVGVQVGDGPMVMLKTKALIDNHCSDWETLARVEVAMLEYNVSFFGDGRASGFLEAIAQKAQALISKTLTDLSVQSSPKAKPPSTS